MPAVGSSERAAQLRRSAATRECKRLDKEFVQGLTHYSRWLVFFFLCAIHTGVC